MYLTWGVSFVLYIYACCPHGMFPFTGIYVQIAVKNCILVNKMINGIPSSLHLICAALPVLKNKRFLSDRDDDWLLPQKK
jgi:hypothetical protein